MILLKILGQAFVVGFSGAMMPGPLLTYNIQLALKKGFWVGPKLVLGHAILEAVLILGISLGLGQLLQLQTTRIMMGIVGGLMLAWMGYGLLRFESKTGNPLNKEAAASGEKRLALNLNPVVSGIIISAMNPYFTLWWATTGLLFITQAFGLGWKGIICFYMGHILADLTWYSLISITIVKSRDLNPRIYQWLLIICGIFLIFLAGQFILDALKLLGGQLQFKAIDLFKGFQKLV
ncbi:MAG TPA: LysE family transporter [Bacillota bacterium]|nr:LysE family transporter [Bacillota bacterium]